ncbi:hypothetical protein MHYP_G00180580 [Metynnis hypsauchen]
MPCFPWCCFRRKKKAAVEKEAVRAAERSSEANTESPDLSQVTATATTEISTASTETHVSTACNSEIPLKMNDAVEKIPVATSEIPATPMLSNDVSVNNDAIPEISLEPSETQLTTLISMISEEVNENSMVDYDTIAEILTATLKAVKADENKGVSQKFSSVSLDSSAVIQKQHGESPGQVEKDEAQSDRAKTPTFTLSLIREHQLMNRGLVNFGNSCYVNASLQCLFCAESFCTQLSSQLSDWIYDSSAQLIRCFTELWWMRESADWGMKASLLMEFIEAAAATNPDFTVDTQNDAHEFLFHVLSQMQHIGQMLSYAGGVAYECPVTASFGFQLTSIITCCGCGAQKSSKVDFNHLSLALPAQGSVKDCLRLFFSDEAEVECRCEVCGCNSASCRWAFHTLPRILVLQLKRFQVSSSFTILKQHNRVHIDTELQLTLPVQRVPEDHTHKEAKPPDHLDLHTPPDEDRKADERQTERNELGDSVFRFSLVSVLNHVGPNIHSGHYLSDCSSQSDSCWLSYNDESVTMTTEERVVKNRQRSAYVLFYETK